jgi:aminoglycoside phosphotransferase (APT) family kinase protein
VTVPWQRELLRHIQRKIPGAENAAIEAIEPISGGFSHQTFRFQLSVGNGAPVRHRRCVLKVQPGAGPLAPYDIAREAHVMQRLAGSAVPVPEVILAEESPGVIGSPFMILEEARGQPMPFFWRTAPSDDACVREHVRMLHRIHSLDWRALGLGFLCDDVSRAIENEIAACRRRAEHHGAGDNPFLNEIANWLARNIPPSMPPSLLHGDPNPANYLFLGNTIVAVLDWEMAALGDPRSDLAFYLAVQTVFGGEWAVPYERFVRIYEQEAGHTLGDMRYFEVLALLKMGAIMLGLERVGNWNLEDAWLRVRRLVEAATKQLTTPE